MQPGDVRVQPVARGVGGVERPVAGALVVVVVGVTGGVVDAGVGVAGINPGKLLRRGVFAPVLDDHLGRSGAAPRLAAAVVLGVLALVDVLGVPRHRQLDAPGAAAGAGGHGEPVGDGGGHRADHAQVRRNPGAVQAIQRDPQLVRRQLHALGGLEGVDVDGAGGVGLVGHAGAVD